MGMAIAHEIVHMFVTFLNGEHYQETPESTNYEPETGVGAAEREGSDEDEDDEIPGHSGQLWEYYMWDGIIEYSYIEERPTGGLIFVSRQGERRGQVGEYRIPDEFAHELAANGRSKSASIVERGGKPGLLIKTRNTNISRAKQTSTSHSSRTARALFDMAIGNLRDVLESAPCSQQDLVIHTPHTVKVWQSKPKYRLNGSDLRRILMSTTATLRYESR